MSIVWIMGPMRGKPPLPSIDSEVVYCSSQSELMDGDLERSGFEVGFSFSS